MPCITRITSIKELQATCDELYNYFVDRLSKVTEIESINGANWTGVCLHIVKTKHCDNCIQITKFIDGSIRFWADGCNGLIVGIYSDVNAIEITTYLNSEDKKYINKSGQKTADQKKRAILLDLKAKLETLFKDFLQ